MKVMKETKNNQWSKLLPRVQNAYNNVQSSSTGLTPYKVVFGQKQHKVLPGIAAN